MSNNIPITNGQGQSSVAAEEISSQKYQQIKVIDGTASSTNKWVVNSDGSAQVSVVGTITTTASGEGSIIAVLKTSSIIGVVTGSVVAIPTGNQSVSGTVGSSIVGWVPIQASNTSIISYIQNSVATVIIGGSVAATFTPPANQSVSGTVGASVIGTVPVTQVTIPWATTAVGSIISTNIGSVITVWKDSSVLAVPVGSVITVFGQSPSIVGTYAEDTAHATGDKGLFALQVRNDTMSSITSADGDYSPIASGPVGETITANAPITKWIRGTADLRVVLGASVTAIAAQGASIFTYITGVQVVNFGPSSVIVTLAGGLGSILGYTIAPAGGGSNIYYPNALKTGENSAFTASINGTASVLVSAQGFIAKI